MAFARSFKQKWGVRPGSILTPFLFLIFYWKRSTGKKRQRVNIRKTRLTKFHVNFERVKNSKKWPWETFMKKLGTLSMAHMSMQCLYARNGFTRDLAVCKGY